MYMMIAVNGKVTTDFRHLYLDLQNLRLTA